VTVSCPLPRRGEIWRLRVAHARELRMICEANALKCKATASIAEGVESGLALMANLQYLTVQDMLWINLQTTKKVQHFQYAKLEEATFYQYGYGAGTGLISQAARFLTGFIRMHPFEAGNEATALIGCVTFLRLNGYCLGISDEGAVQWLDGILTHQVTAIDAVTKAATPIEGFHAPQQPDIKGNILDVVGSFEKTVGELSNRSAMAK